MIGVWRRRLCLLLHGRLVVMSDGFEMCTGCRRMFWRGTSWDGETGPEGTA